VAAQFVDNGLAKQLVGPADANFDHANFYWRMELQGEMAATIHGAATVGNDSLKMKANRYRNMTARITRGRGAGEERTIVSNDATTVTVGPAWTVTPDATSYFAVTEAGWQFGAVSATSPVQFAIPNRAGETVEIMGQPANAAGVECAAELSLVTRWKIGGSGTTDADVPEMPFFGLGAGAKAGTVELSGVSFTDLVNTLTIRAATLTLHYWDELSGPPSLTLAGAMAAGDATVALSAVGPAVAGDLVQIEGEVLRVDAVLNVGLTYQVTRGMHGSAAAAHAAGSGVYGLQSRTAIAPFTEGFFGSPYSGSWSFPVSLPDARIASAELFVTNARGQSPVRAVCLTSTVDNGLRILSGGQYSIEVQGFLAVDAEAAPAVVVEASHAVRDVFAVLGTAADADVVLRVKVDGSEYCVLTVAAGQTTSASVSGLVAGPLRAGSKVTLSVVAVGTVYAGKDLTVVIRL
jgi:hypothetical protein